MQQYQPSSYSSSGTDPSPPPRPPHSGQAPSGENYSYVQLTTVHDYNYTVVNEPIGRLVRGTTATTTSSTRRDSTNSIKKLGALDASAHSLKDAGHGKNRLRCRYVVGSSLHRYLLAQQFGLF